VTVVVIVDAGKVTMLEITDVSVEVTVWKAVAVCVKVEMLMLPRRVVTELTVITLVLAGSVVATPD
jgi:hypothetical protein